MPSISIYATELFKEYDVQAVTRVGSCGALSEELKLRDLVIASGACSDSAINRITFEGFDYAPVADFDLLRRAVDAAATLGITMHVGSVASFDNFYTDRPDIFEKLARYGVLAVEMESAALYTVASRFQARALTLLTVSDHIKSGLHTTAAEREQTFSEMIEIALATIVES